MENSSETLLIHHIKGLPTRSPSTKIVGRRQPVQNETGYNVASNGADTTGVGADSLIRVLRDLTSVQRNLANLQVELQGRQVQTWLQTTALG
jgi:hypothetical protein